MSDRTRPLRVMYSFSDRIGRAGIGLTAWHQVTSLARCGAQVRVYCPLSDLPFESDVKVVETMRYGKLPLPLRKFGRYRPRMIHDRYVAKALRRMAGEFDLVHCWPSAALDTIRTARSLGVATFLERPNAHTRLAIDWVARECASLGVQMASGHSHAFNEKKLLREEAEFDLADWLLCPSDFVAESFRSMGFPESRIARHQYGYDPARFSELHNGERKNKKEGLTVAFVGSCEPRKGLHHALKAWLSSAAAENGSFHICGEFVSGYRDLLAEMLDHPSVIEHGFERDVPSVMRNCDVLVLPSVEEGSALVTYEARACGCVLLVSEASGARCEHMKNGLIHSVGDVEALRDHMSQLASNRALLDRLRRASLEGLDELTWAHAGRALVDIYSSRVRLKE